MALFLGHCSQLVWLDSVRRRRDFSLKQHIDVRLTAVKRLPGTTALDHWEGISVFVCAWKLVNECRKHHDQCSTVFPPFLCTQGPPISLPDICLGATKVSPLWLWNHLGAVIITLSCLPASHPGPRATEFRYFRAALTRSMVTRSIAHYLLRSQSLESSDTRGRDFEWRIYLCLVD